VRYGRAIATWGLAVIAFGSLVLGSPFTEQYAREQVDESGWGLPIFRALNRRITTLWGVVFVAMACSHVVAGAIDTRRSDTFFDWVIPIVLVVLILRYTESAETSAKSSAVPS
jgi:uncharacterized membrane protein